MSDSLGRKNTQVLGINIAAANTQLALRWIVEDLKAQRKGYVCFVSVHGLMEARRDRSFAESYAHAALRLPDGAPVAWVGRLQGEEEMRRVAGPELMLDVFADKRLRHVTHYFYGGDEGVAPLLRERILQRFPHAKIVGTFTPPFRELNAAEEASFLEEIQRLKPDIIWVGIGCPKQEQFMRRYIDQLQTTLMFGVGAAFDFHTGRIQDSPAWVKRAGLQWCHRLIQDPRRLWKRYLVSNTTFLYHLALQAAGVITRVPPSEPVRTPEPRSMR